MTIVFQSIQFFFEEARTRGEPLIVDQMCRPARLNALNSLFRGTQKAVIVVIIWEASAKALCVEHIFCQELNKHIQISSAGALIVILIF